MIELKDINRKDKILIAAHRGDQTKAVENTLQAFDDAIAAGVDMIETDVHITKDKRLILFHNSFVNHANKKIAINELSFAEIQKIEMFDRESKAKIAIPELSDLLKLAKNKCYLNIEIKRNNIFSNQEYIDTVLDSIAKHGELSQLIFASFYYDLLEEFKKKSSDILTAGIRIPRQPLSPIELVNMIGIDAYITSLSSLNLEITANAQKAGVILGAYSIDNEKHFQKALKYGVTAMGTNKASEMVKIVEKYNKKQYNKEQGKKP